MAKFSLFNFKRMLGIRNNQDYAATNEAMQAKLAELFNSVEGQQVLAWLFHSFVVQAPAVQALSKEELHYQAGKVDFIKHIYAISNFNFEENSND